MIIMFVLPFSVSADEHGDHSGSLIRYIIRMEAEKYNREGRKDKIALGIFKDIDIGVGLGGEDKSNWPGFIKKCGDHCLSVIKMLHNNNCTESVDEIMLRLDSPIYDFVITDDLIGGLGRWNLESDYYTSPYFLSSCDLILSYHVKSRLKDSPEQTKRMHYILNVKFTAILFTSTSGEMRPIVEQILQDRDQIYLCDSPPGCGAFEM